jgi:hypothetical protein
VARDADEVDGEFDSIRWVAFAFVARGKERGEKKEGGGCFGKGRAGGVDVFGFQLWVFYSFRSVLMRGGRSIWPAGGSGRS